MKTVVAHEESNMPVVKNPAKSLGQGVGGINDVGNVKKSDVTKGTPLS